MAIYWPTPGFKGCGLNPGRSGGRIFEFPLNSVFSTDETFISASAAPHCGILEDRLTNKISYCFLFLSWKSSTGVVLKYSRVSKIQKLRWKPRCPSNKVSTVSVTNKIAFPCHIWLWRQFTSSTSSCFPVPRWGSFHVTKNNARTAEVLFKRVLCEWIFLSCTVFRFSSIVDVHKWINVK